MASFGSFETTREIYAGPTYTVYAAKKSGDPKTEYAVKVFSAHRTDLEAESIEQLDPLMSDIETSCVQRISVQQQAGAGSRFVAPVLETGQDERGVWYATQFYPRSVNRIISGRVALNRDALEHIVLSVARGALDIKKFCSRSHGEILPSNVQIGRSDKLVEADVVLSDPMPGGRGDAGRYELSDLRAIGMILLQLVLQREISPEESADLILPILPTPEWTRLFGKDSAQWLLLCNRLLDPALSLEKLSLESLLQELEQMRSKPAVSRKLGISVAVAVLVLGGAGIFLAMFFKKGNLAITTDPPGAEIKLEVDGAYRSYGKTPTDKQPLVVKGLPKGAYKIKAEYPELADQIEAVTVEGGKTRPYQIAFPYGTVKITSTPGNASVESEGKALGVTPFTSPVFAPGSRTFNLSLTNHRPARLSVIISSNRLTVSIETNLIQLKKDEGLVEFQSEPSGATIREGTNTLGETPVPDYLSLGTHLITAQYQDWAPVSTQVVVYAGETNPPVKFRFPYGVARFDITPSDSDVFIDDKPLGRDVRTRALQPTNYLVRVTRQGYKPFEKRITVTDRGTTPITVSLEPMLGFVEITTDPPGASIFEAKAPTQELGKTQPGQPFKKSFQPGSYAFIATYPGLDSVQSKSVDIAMGANISVVLPFVYGAARFETEPPGANVVIGASRNATPYTYRQKPGAISYRVELEDYYPEEGNQDLKAGATIPITFRLRPKDVAITLRSDPPGAQFLVANTALKGANDLYSMPWGTNSITAKYSSIPGLPELEVQTQTVNVDKSGKSSLKFDFKYGIIEITNSEPEVRILYQGKVLTNLPARLVLKPDFQHDLVFDYGVDWNTNLSFKVAAGERRVVGIALPELRRTFTNSVNMVLIRVSRNLYAGQFEVTEEEYHKLVPGALQGKPHQPVVNVNWKDAQKFCEQLSAADKDLLARWKLNGWKYALPTETEWKSYAEPVAAVLDGSFFSNQGLQEPAEIDWSRKSVSSIGLYDVFGNAAEWCESTDAQPIVVGGSIANAKPKPETALARLKTMNLPAGVIADGSPTIGFRCVLRRTAQ